MIAEIGQSMCMLREYAIASMRPRSYDRGNVHSHMFGAGCGSYMHASMRPRSYDRGNLICYLLYRPVDILASMRPRSYDRGNLDPCPACRSIRTRFNEAAIL